MIRYLLDRPVAIFLSFVIVCGLGFFFLGKIPVSLLPDIDVPQIVLSVAYPDYNAQQVETEVLKPLRDGLLTVHHLQDIETKAAHHSGSIFLRYEHGTRMDLAYIEINEKLDRLTTSLPRGMARPLVSRINTSDIPILRLHIWPDTSSILQHELSDLCRQILKKRIEQIEGVSIVDINGTSDEMISVTPNESTLNAYGLDPTAITQAIKNANQELGSMSIRDGQYRYFVRIANELKDTQQILDISVPTAKGYIPLHELADVKYIPSKKLGYHSYMGHEGMVITIQKQAQARMQDLMPRLYAAIDHFKKEYTGLQFATSRDQKFLLDAGIDNLKQDILYGGILTIALLFLFLGHWSAPTLMSISIPLSLIISVVFFYWFDVSFNIISLSGIALGIGMLIDNSIVVIDHISRKRKEGLSLDESAVTGTREMMAPVISQVLTTVAVYAPLVLLHGMAGDMIKDQAKALTISLIVSLAVAFVLAPMLYKKLLTVISHGQIKDNTIFYKWIERGYHRMIDHILRFKMVYFILTILVMPVGFWIATKLPVRALPEIEKTESLVQIQWNEPIDAEENKLRTQSLAIAIPHVLNYEADIGVQQFLLQEKSKSIEETEIYFLHTSSSEKINNDIAIEAWLKKEYPRASWTILDAPNAFTQLFVSDAPYFEARFAAIHDQSDDAIRKMANTYPQAKPGASLTEETILEMIPDYDKMALYGITRSMLDDALQQLYGSYPVTDLKASGEITSIILQSSVIKNQELSNQYITNAQGIRYPLSSFIHTRYDSHAKYITADKSGTYHNLVWDHAPNKQTIDQLQKQLGSFGAQQGMPVHFSGTYFDDQKQLRQLVLIFLIVLLLMYFILAVQYESLVQPLMVMLTIPLGIFGAMLVLYYTGGALDTMAAIGFIVILGLIVDDPILKIETLNRLSAKYKTAGLAMDDVLLKKMIHEAGSICLKPLLMVSLTTTLALVPVLFIPGLGNELQKPMVWVIIGGLTIGTFFTTWFIPLVYWYWMKYKL